MSCDASFRRSRHACGAPLRRAAGRAGSRRRLQPLCHARRVLVRFGLQLHRRLPNRVHVAFDGARGGDQFGLFPLERPVDRLLKRRKAPLVLVEESGGRAADIF